MCFKFKIQEDAEGEFVAHVPPRPVSHRGQANGRVSTSLVRSSSQRFYVEDRSPHASGQLRRNISVSERSPRASAQVAIGRVTVSERSPRTSRNRLSGTHLVVPTSQRSTNRLLEPNYVELPRAEPVQIPAFQAEPTFVERRSPPPPEAPEPPRNARSVRSDSVHGERHGSRSRAYSTSRGGDFLTPQQSPRAASHSPRSSGALVDSGGRHRADSTSRHERRSSRDRPRSRYAEDAERLSREPSQNRQRDSHLYLEDGRQNEGARFLEERIIQGDSRTTKQYYYV